MDPILSGVIGLIVLCVLLIIGVPIAFSMFIVGFGGLVYANGLTGAVSMAGTTAYHATANWLYLVIPMFILMGEFAGKADIITDLFSSVKAWFGRIRGALGVVTIITSAIFAFATGSSLAATAVMGKVALPEMERENYQRKFALTTVAAGGTLGNMIPPSIGLTLFAIVTQQSIGKLLIAGVMPGLLVTAMFIGFVFYSVWRDPKVAPASESVSWTEKWRSLRKVWGMIAVMLFVLGGIYSGIATITEAATMGAFGAFLVGLFIKRLNMAKIQECLINTMTLSAVLFFLLFSVALFTRFLAFSGFTGELTNLITGSGMSPLLTLVLVLFIYFILGMIIDATSMMLLVVPVAFPILTALGFDPIWFGVLTVAMIQIGQITPPVGMITYVLKGVSGASLEESFKACWPVFTIWVLLVISLIIWPDIALWLPRGM